MTLPHTQHICSLERPQNKDGLDSQDNRGVKVCDGLLVGGVARLTDFSCGQVHLVVGDMAHTITLGAGLKRPF